jgi:hypothetical protein
MTPRRQLQALSGWIAEVNPANYLYAEMPTRVLFRALSFFHLLAVGLRRRSGCRTY